MLVQLQAELGEAALRCSIGSGRRSLPSSRESCAAYARLASARAGAGSPPVSTLPPDADHPERDRVHRVGICSRERGCAGAGSANSAPAIPVKIAAGSLQMGARPPPIQRRTPRATTRSTSSSMLICNWDRTSKRSASSMGATASPNIRRTEEEEDWGADRE
jgi:hypothetical protein